MPAVELQLQVRGRGRSWAGPGRAGREGGIHQPSPQATTTCPRCTWTCQASPSQTAGCWLSEGLQVPTRKTFGSKLPQGGGEGGGVTRR